MHCDMEFKHISFFFADKKTARGNFQFLMCHYKGSVKCLQVGSRGCKD